VIAAEDEAPGGEPLLVEAMRGGEILHAESLDRIRERTASQLAALPDALRPPEDDVDPYPVGYSERLEAFMNPATPDMGASPPRPPTGGLPRRSTSRE
jgi:hypothetical protein